MSLSFDLCNNTAVSVGADERIVKYRLFDEISSISKSEVNSTSTEDRKEEDVSSTLRAQVLKSNHAGRSSTSISENGKVCAIGGWDGR